MYINHFEEQGLGTLEDIYDAINLWEDDGANFFDAIWMLTASLNQQYAHKPNMFSWAKARRIFNFMVARPAYEAWFVQTAYEFVNIPQEHFTG